MEKNKDGRDENHNSGTVTGRWIWRDRFRVCARLRRGAY